MPETNLYNLNQFENWASATALLLSNELQISFKRFHFFKINT